MKLRRFNVVYNVTISYDADVLAENKNAAIAKVIEVIGAPIHIEAAYELPIKVLPHEV